MSTYLVHNSHLTEALIGGSQVPVPVFVGVRNKWRRERCVSRHATTGTMDTGAVAGVGSSGGLQASVLLRDIGRTLLL